MTDQAYVMREAPELFGRTIFAEDARFEVSGQFTLVGVIPTAGIDLAEFPSVIPKLAMMIEFQQRPDVEADDVRIAVFMPGAGTEEPAFDHTITKDEWLKEGVGFGAIEHNSPYPSPLVRRVTQVVVTSNLEIKRPGMIQVRAFRRREVIGLGALRVIPTSEKQV
ncbi:hypothetical protein [Brevundimonas naejangsanensis]|uniref:hypothetical protein n=1 Tax=Brevundimonas naejangsanensis TaxID=588932 RepID=UPI0012DC5E62|nr:hypothetical protein [Brevundimonas naejangsanensis]